MCGPGEKPPLRPGVGSAQTGSCRPAGPRCAAPVLSLFRLPSFFLPRWPDPSSGGQPFSVSSHPHRHKGKALVLRSTVICPRNPLLAAYCAFASAPPPALGPSISIASPQCLRSPADLGCGAGSDLVTPGQVTVFPLPSGSLASSCSQWSSGALVTIPPPAPRLPSPPRPHLLPFPAPTPGLALPFFSSPPAQRLPLPLCPLLVS